MPAIPQFEMGNSIPKIIHQTYPDKSQLAVELQENIARICQLNPGWEHRLHDDADIESVILKYYGLEILQVYKRITPEYGAARADFFRYLMIYAVGGVYLDIKSTLTRPLDDVLLPDDLYILSQWDQYFGEGWKAWQKEELPSIPGGEYQQWHVISTAGHPFLRAVLERVIYNIQHYDILKYRAGQGGVLRTTATIPYTLAIENIKSLHPYRMVNIRTDFGIIYSIYGDLSSHRKNFKTHYSILTTPIIMPTSLHDYIRMYIFYAAKFSQRILNKILF